jgi:hypothetical protein
MARPFKGCSSCRNAGQARRHGGLAVGVTGYVLGRSAAGKCLEERTGVVEDLVVGFGLEGGAKVASRRRDICDLLRHDTVLVAPRARANGEPRAARSPSAGRCTGFGPIRLPAALGRTTPGQRLEAGS